MRLRPTLLGIALASCAALANAAGAAGSAASSYPNQPINLVVTYSAGGGADTTARIMAKALTEELHQNVVVENKTGASGSIGAAYVARSAPDGYTVLYDATAFAINPSLRKLPYDVKKDFIPVSQAVRVPNILVVAKNSPFNTLGDFIKAAEAEPGKYTIASSGTGSIAHMAAELLKKDTGINIVHVPYKGGAPALVDVIGGQVNAYFANVATSLPYITSGQVKALAVTSTQRLADLPNLPTVQESGVKDFVAEEWNGFLLPAGTPPAIVDKLYGAIRSALARPDVKQQFAKLGQIPVGSSPKQFAQFLDEQGTRWDAVVKANHITIN